MLAAMTSFASMSIILRHVTQDVHPFEVAFFRSFLGLIILLPWIVKAGGTRMLRTRRLGLFTLRGAFNVTSMLAWFTAVTMMPLADLTALSFTAPLWATLFAALVLHEVVRARRWSATAIGFLGALIILRPGFSDMNMGALLVLLSSATWAMTTIVIRVLTRTEESSTIVIWQALMMAILSLPPALLVWQWPTPEAFLWLCLLSGIATFGHMCHVRACSMQEVAALQPLEFAKLPVVALLAFLIYEEIPSIWVWVGAVIIFASGMYISYREARLKKSAGPASKSAVEDRAAAA